MSKVISIDDHMQRVWDEWRSAQDKAHLSGSMEDGKAAGRAWRRWLTLFTPEGQKHILEDRRASA